MSTIKPDTAPGIKPSFKVNDGRDTAPQLSRGITLHRDPAKGNPIDVPNTFHIHWTRREWLARNMTAVCMAVPVSRLSVGLLPRAKGNVTKVTSDVVGKSQNAFGTLADREALAQHAVDIAQRAGAQYADARLTYKQRQVLTEDLYMGRYAVEDIEDWGVGVRVLVNGYWGFAGCPSGDLAAVEKLARQALAQAAVNGRGAVPRTVEMGQIPAAVGRWSTPHKIDPFTVPVEEKEAFLWYYNGCAQKNDMYFGEYGNTKIWFDREERVVATSDGSRFTQTLLESGGDFPCNSGNSTYQLEKGEGSVIHIKGIETQGRGWELFEEAKIPDQMPGIPEQIIALAALRQSIRPASIGRYTLVCDGATMAALLSATLGAALQLDRALGYEANAGGTSLIDDPFAMLGTFKVASPLVNVTTNRSAPRQLATVKWDDEGVEPSGAQLVTDGVLTDFQTNREQAGWLAPYYAKAGRPVRSNGCATAESALGFTMQHMPNLSLEPGKSSAGTEDLVADVKDGIYIERGVVMQMDFQLRNGLLLASSAGMMRKIRNGKLGPPLSGGIVQFNTLDLWRHVIAVGGTSTSMVVPFSQYPMGGEFACFFGRPTKGEPPQLTSHSVQAVAATITNQPLIDIQRKA